MTERGRQKAECAGRWAELVALWALRCKGYRLLAHRYKSHAGEIDLIMRKGEVTAFIEVKARATRDAAIAETDGTIRVSVAPTPRPGNWIAAPDNRGFELIYSAAGSDGGAGFASGNVPLFTIKQAGC